VVATDGVRQVQYVECGVLTADPARPMEHRLGEIACWLTDVINELRPAVVAVEDVFSSVNPRSALALAQARGTVLAVAGMAGLAVHSYAPAVVKKTVTGRGRASKEQVARMVQALVGLRRPPRADAADALAVAIAHAQRLEAP
jgi:crossover junction endodeoxyribonuclease RuvC